MFNELLFYGGGAAAFQSGDNILVLDMINLNVLELPEDPQLLKTEMGDCGLQLSAINKFD